jgi:hypothetical protein
VVKIDQPAKQHHAKQTSGVCRSIEGAGMHGGIFVGEPYDLFRTRAQEFIDRARDETNPQDRRLWLDLALECLGLAANAKSLAAATALVPDLQLRARS